MGGFWKNEQISPLFLCKLRMADTTLLLKSALSVTIMRPKCFPHEPMNNTENADRPLSAMLVFSVAALALTPIRQTGAGAFRRRDRTSQGVHAGIESETPPRRQPIPSFPMR
jgi:hypothetical protein